MDFIKYSNLSSVKEIEHFTTMRYGGVSEGEYQSLNLGLFTADNKENIVENKNRLCKELKIPSSHLLIAKQTHQTKTVAIGEDFFQYSVADQAKLLNGVDALCTDIKGVCVTVTTADCVPVLLYDRRNYAVAAIHSGWRGTVENICKKSFSVMQKTYGSKSENIVAAVGVCISQNIYEVGDDLFKSFHKKSSDYDSFFLPCDNGKYLLNLRGIVALQLKKIGIVNIEVSNLCSYSDSRFFSARRQGVNSGRMLTGIFLK